MESVLDVAAAELARAEARNAGTVGGTDPGAA